MSGSSISPSVALAAADAAEARLRASAWTVVATTAIVLCLHWLFRRGMFYDGALYATIARNLACGLGDAWNPQASATFLHQFREHPPLAFWLQACWFWVLGDHIWVERAYSATSGVVTALLVVGIWKRLFAERPQAQSYAWLPVALWLSCCSWCYVHNMLENTLGIFTALSVYSALRAADRERSMLAWSLLAGISLTAAVLAKGPVGLFPLVTPAIGWLTLRRTSWRTAARSQLVMMAVWAGSLAALMSIAACRLYLMQYWQQQVVASLSGCREGNPTLVGHGALLMLLAQVIFIPLAISTALVLAARCRSGSSVVTERLIEPESLGRIGWFCLLMALCASLPLLLSPKQAGHYAAPSYPLFVLACSSWCLPAVGELSRVLAKAVSGRAWLAVRLVATCTIAAATFSAWTSYGGCVRNRELIELADQIADRFGPHGVVFVEPADWQRLPATDRLLLHTYLYRYHFVSLSTRESEPALRFEFHRLEPLPAGWVVAADQTTRIGGLTCSAVVRCRVVLTAELPIARR